MRVKQAGEHARGTVAPLDEYSGDCFRRGGKVRSRDSIHSGEKGEKKVEQIRVIARTQGTFASLEFIPRKRLEKVSKECGGRYKFESRDEVLIFVSIAAEVGLQLGSREWATIGVWRGATGQRDHEGVAQFEVSVGAVGWETWVCSQQDDLQDVVSFHQHMPHGL